MGRRVVHVVGTLNVSAAALFSIACCLTWHERIYVTALVLPLYSHEAGLLNINTSSSNTFLTFLMNVVYRTAGANPVSQDQGKETLVEKYVSATSGTHGLRDCADYYCSATSNQLGRLMFGEACAAFNGVYWAGLVVIIGGAFAITLSIVSTGYAYYYAYHSPKKTYRILALALSAMPPLFVIGWSAFYMWAAQHMDSPFAGSQLADNLASTSKGTTGVSKGFICGMFTFVPYLVAAVALTRLKVKGELFLKDMKEQRLLDEQAALLEQSYGATYGEASPYDPTYEGYNQPYAAPPM